MTYEQDLEAALDETSVRLVDGYMVATLVMKRRFHLQYAFAVTWRTGHEVDWSWQGSETWLQTELNAEQLGIEPSELLALAQGAIAQFANASNAGNVASAPTI